LASLDYAHGASCSTASCSKPPRSGQYRTDASSGTSESSAKPDTTCSVCLSHVDIPDSRKRATARPPRCCEGAVRLSSWCAIR
jgi:hypothetical protein